MTIGVELWVTGFGGEIGGIRGELAHAHINQKMHQKYIYGRDDSVCASSWVTS